MSLILLPLVLLSCLFLFSLSPRLFSFSLFFSNLYLSLSLSHSLITCVSLTLHLSVLPFIFSYNPFLSISLSLKTYKAVNIDSSSKLFCNQIVKCRPFLSSFIALINDRVYIITVCGMFPCRDNVF